MPSKETASEKDWRLRMEREAIRYADWNRRKRHKTDPQVKQDQPTPTPDRFADVVRFRATIASVRFAIRKACGYVMPTEDLPWHCWGECCGGTSITPDIDGSGSWGRHVRMYEDRDDTP